jgi:hypothetical protein
LRQDHPFPAVVAIRQWDDRRETIDKGMGALAFLPFVFWVRCEHQAGPGPDFAEEGAPGAEPEEFRRQVWEWQETQPHHPASAPIGTDELLPVLATYLTEPNVFEGVYLGQEPYRGQRRFPNLYPGRPEPPLPADADLVIRPVLTRWARWCTGIAAGRGRTASSTSSKTCCRRSGEVWNPSRAI